MKIKARIDRMVNTDNVKAIASVSLDRCCDISRLTYDGVNMGYFSPCGYVAPSYYQPTGTDWLKSFTAGFLTTCGLNAVGSPCVDDGEALPLHGSIANTPASDVCWYEENGELVVRAIIRDEQIFGRKLRLYRRIHVSLQKNAFRICDTIENTGDRQEPVEILYHMNMGYLSGCQYGNRPSNAVLFPRRRIFWRKQEYGGPHGRQRCYGSD